MASPDGTDAIIERARAALRRLGDAELSREAARAALEELDAAWQRRPLTAGVLGDDAAARTALLNALCGGPLLDAAERGPKSPPVRLRRGAATRLRARREDGTVEEATLPASEAATAAAAPAAAVVVPRRARRPTTDWMRAQVRKQELVLLQIEDTLPRVAREAPPWWAFWLWLIRWLVMPRMREKLVVWERAKRELADAQLLLAAASEESVPVVSMGPPLGPPLETRAEPGPRARFLERLRELGSGTLAGQGVQELELEVDGGPLTDEIEVIELLGAAAASPVDLTLRATASQVEIAGGPGGARQELGSPAEAAPAFARLLVEARALAIARRAGEVLRAEIARLDESVVNAEIALRNRSARLETLHMPDAESFVPAQLERIGAQASASIYAVLEHAGVHLGSELAQRAAQWDAEIAAVTAFDALKALAARIDAEGVAEYKRIADETRMLVVGGVGGSAYDLLAEVFAPLRQPGLPDEHAVPPRRVPSLSPVAMLPSLTGAQPSAFAGELSGAGQRIAALFRSIDTKRTELRDKVSERSEHVRVTAEADLLDAEPKLRAALLEAVGRELTVAVEKRVAWLATERANEQAAIDAERAALSPLTSVLEDVRREVRSLQARVGAIEAPLA
ncbi:MAG TPA: hypothetical protein VNO30_23535 [Kofleriaceae bacterium]|nr:hypothetical protein [Kofleriaceae bacterium]